MRKPPLVRIKLTPSRIGKGLLAIPKRYQRLFPKRAGQVTVLLENEVSAERKQFTSYRSPARESRIYGLRHWFEQRKAQAGDWVDLSVVDALNAVYALVFHGRAAEEQRSRKAFESAQTEDQADQALGELAKARWQSRRTAALKELHRLAEMEWERGRVHLPSADRYEGAPAVVRALLCAIYGGRCQICGFTFRTRSEQPYFEVHHLEPNAGHQPQNLLALCANCHVLMEHTEVALERDAFGWVRAAVINGERKAVHQALGTGSASAGITALLALLALRLSWLGKSWLA